MSSQPQNNASNPPLASNQTQQQKSELTPEQKQENYHQFQQIMDLNPHQNAQGSPIQEQHSESQKNNEKPKPNDQLKLDQQNSMQISNRIQSINKNFNFNPSSNEKPPSCHCKKSKCLKMYCDCFAKGNKCRDTCKCIGCENTKNSNRQKKPDSRNQEEIQRSEDSNKKSLKPKQKCCNCKKSFCLKKYCECYNANVPCTENCKCEDCKNNGQNHSFKDDKTPGNPSQIDQPSFNMTINKQISQGISELNVVNDKREEVTARKRQKPDEDEIQTKISQILKLVPEQNYQTMLDFLAYCLS